jgi:hypothetical protein
MNKEIKITLYESDFTNLCKIGYFSVKTESGTSDIRFTKNDIRTIINFDSVEKEVDGDSFIYSLQMNDEELIREIVKRSPIYSDIIT